MNNISIEGDKPLVSIIVPIYKVENYVRRCVESILSQTYTNIEVLLVDDASTDECGKIIDEFGKMDSRIVCIHLDTNSGLSEARNVGIKRAKGDLLFFVDGDDTISKFTIELFYNRMKTDNSEIVIGDFMYVDEANIKIEDIPPVINPLFSDSGALPSEMILNELLTNPACYHFIVVWNKLYKKELFENISFAKGKYHEDNYIMHHLVSLCSSISYVAGKTYFYTQRDDSIVKIINPKRYLDKCGAFIDMIAFCADNGLFTKAGMAFKQAIGHYVVAYDADKEKAYQREFENIYNSIRSVYKSFNWKVGFVNWILIHLFFVSPKLCSNALKIISPGIFG